MTDPIRARLDDWQYFRAAPPDLVDALRAVLDLCDTRAAQEHDTAFARGIRSVIAEHLGVTDV